MVYAVASQLERAHLPHEVIDTRAAPLVAYLASAQPQPTERPLSSGVIPWTEPPSPEPAVEADALMAERTLHWSDPELGIRVWVRPAAV